MDQLLRANSEDPWVKALLRADAAETKAPLLGDLLVTTLVHDSLPAQGEFCHCVPGKTTPFLPHSPDYLLLVHYLKQPSPPDQNPVLQSLWFQALFFPFICNTWCLPKVQFFLCVGRILRS